MTWFAMMSPLVRRGPAWARRQRESWGQTRADGWAHTLGLGGSACACLLGTIDLAYTTTAMGRKKKSSGFYAKITQSSQIDRRLSHQRVWRARPFDHLA